MSKAPRLREEHIRLILTSADPPARLASQVGVSRACIYEVRTGRTYRHVLPELPRRQGQNRRLSLEEVREILTSRESSRLLSERLGVSREAVNAIRRGRNYANVLPNIPRHPVHTRRFSAAEINAIRLSDQSNYALAQRYGVHHKTIKEIRDRTLYRDIETIPQVHCLRCRHWCDGCGFGLPEALEDGTFAQECLHYTA